MDLKAFYKKVREVEDAITEEFVVVMSLETPGGGRAGVASEVSRRIAATMIVQRCARFASEEETKAFKEAQLEARRRAEEEQAAKKVQIAILPESQLKSRRSGTKADR